MPFVQSPDNNWLRRSLSQQCDSEKCLFSRLLLHFSEKLNDKTLFLSIFVHLFLTLSLKKKPSGRHSPFFEKKKSLSKRERENDRKCRELIIRSTSLFPSKRYRINDSAFVDYAMLSTSLFMKFKSVKPKKVGYLLLVSSG